MLCDVVHIGGEGGAAVLVTSDGAYDLFVPRERRGRWKWNLEPFNSKRVVVIGRPFTAKGIERKRYRAIHVIDLKPE